MDERKQKVLRAIIMDYINTAEPVGSRTIAKKYDLGVSSATIRNEMSDLEELGLIEQPHTSAGRVPSDKGYRYYVDHLMDEDDLVTGERDLIRTFFTDRMNRLDQLYHETCKVLSELSPYVTMIMTPTKSTGALQQLQLMPITPFQAVLVIVTDVGLVHHRTVDFPVPVSKERLAEIGDILLSKLKGRNIEDINTTLMREISGELQAELDIVDSIFEMMSDAMKSTGEEKIFLEGTLKILNQPEFNDVNRVKEVLSFLQEEDVLRELLHGKSGIGMNFTIGDELSSEKINRCSMVTCTYSINGNTVGNIGILGPTRMEYGKSASLIREVAKQLSNVLENKPK
ncbi:MAG: heat-inducible transcription repressor HrcA [Firmicutes bacterium]|nr:heat-inducible transcription repressor HrcA [Bacillota bacterium]MBQ6809859.1 heat-inducible transcription repressor HrcA [Bacillota bacterium]